MADETFGQLIKKLRERKGWSLRQAAEQIGDVSFVYLSQLEAGVAKRPSEDLARRIASTYGTDEEKLVFLARGIPEQLEAIMEKFPREAKAYLRRAKRSK